MLVLSALHNLLSRSLSLPDLHTVILFTASGDLVSYASDSTRSKDEIRIVVGLSGEIWQETKEQGFGMVDSEVGRIIVFPVDDFTTEPEQYSEGKLPLILLALNATNSVGWDELHARGTMLAEHIANSLSPFRRFLVVATPPSVNATTTTFPVPKPIQSR